MNNLIIESAHILDGSIRSYNPTMGTLKWHAILTGETPFEMVFIPEQADDVNSVKLYISFDHIRAEAFVSLYHEYDEGNRLPIKGVGESTLSILNVSKYDRWTDLSDKSVDIPTAVIAAGIHVKPHTGGMIEFALLHFEHSVISRAIQEAFKNASDVYENWKLSQEK